jgi:hypothetical protein
LVQNTDAQISGQKYMEGIEYKNKNIQMFITVGIVNVIHSFSVDVAL